MTETETETLTLKIFASATSFHWIHYLSHQMAIILKNIIIEHIVLQK